MNEQLTKKSEELVKTIQQQNEYKNKLINELRQVDNNLIYLQGMLDLTNQLLNTKEEPKNDEQI